MILEKKNIVGIDITNASEEDILKYIGETLQNSSKKISIVTPNPEMIVYAISHSSFATLLNSADISLADGMGVIVAGNILGKSLRERVTGTDLMEKLCAKSIDWVATIGFLGGQDGVADKTAECLITKYPGLKIGFIGREWNDEGFAKAAEMMTRYEKNNEWREKKNNVRESSGNNSLDILFVAYGFPKQEEWIAQHLETVNVRLAMGVGGAFDYHSGSVIRAPHLVRVLGFEWLFRLVRQPWRLKRQLALLVFIRLVLRERWIAKHR